MSSSRKIHSLASSSSSKGCTAVRDHVLDARPSLQGTRVLLPPTEGGVTHENPFLLDSLDVLRLWRVV
jgi:hypothetical protein